MCINKKESDSPPHTMSLDTKLSYENIFCAYLYLPKAFWHDKMKTFQNTQTHTKFSYIFHSFLYPVLVFKIRSFFVSSDLRYIIKKTRRTSLYTNFPFQLFLTTLQCINTHLRYFMVRIFHSV